MADESKLEGNFILDSSVVIKWFSEEEDTATALEFREGYIQGELEIVTPDLLLYEIANALRYNKMLMKMMLKKQ